MEQHTPPIGTPSHSDCRRRGRPSNYSVLWDLPTQILTCQTQKVPGMFVKKMRLIHGKSANTRTGPPEPPSNLIGATIMNAPVSDNSLRSARFSRWYKPAPNDK